MRREVFKKAEKYEMSRKAPINLEVVYEKGYLWKKYFSFFLSKFWFSLAEKIISKKGQKSVIFLGVP
ncbi:MAG: hypothetical protein LBF22_05635 [Deltaproteobacteria bacterium]|nr:hypothetical protein [Deltaproteobacteria bacterium]